MPEYLISSKKGQCYLDNFKLHKNNKYIVTLDVEKFFPKCNASFVYNFFKKFFLMSNDVAYLLTQLCTIDTNKSNLSEEVIEWFNQTNQKLYYPLPNSHIPTGSPLSQILAFLAFQNMFDEIMDYCSSNNITMTLYVDDITLSSNKKISKNHIYVIKNILNTYGHNVNYKKIRIYKPNYNKKITGVILDKNNIPKATMKLHYKVHKHSIEYKINKDEALKRKLLGEMYAIYLIEPTKYHNSIGLLKRNDFS